MRARMLTAGVALVLALGACGGRSDDATVAIDDGSGWRAVVEARTGDAFNTDAAWNRYRRKVEKKCELNHEVSWLTHIAIEVETGGSTAGVEEDASFACPDGLEAVREAVATYEGVLREVDIACSIVPRSRTVGQRDLVENIGCDD